MTINSSTSKIKTKGEPLISSKNKDKKINFKSSFTQIWQMGDSITDGSGATDDSYKFSELVANSLGLTANNISISGGGIRDQVIKSFIELPSTGIVDPIMIEIGLNDIRKAGDNPKTYNKILCGLRALILRSNLSSAVAASNGAVIKTGTWTDVVNTVGTNSDLSLSGTAKSSVNTGSTMAWSFTGTRLVIGALVSDEVIEHSGTFTIDIDGTSYGTYDGRGLTDGETGYLSSSAGIPSQLLPYNNALTHNAWYIDLLHTGSHTVTITTTSTTPTYIDYFGTFNDQLNRVPILIYDIPYMTPYGHSQSSVYTDDNIIDKANEFILKVVQEFENFNVVKVYVNDFFTPGTDQSYGDGIHPKDLGHVNFAESILSKISNISLSIIPISFSNMILLNAKLGMQVYCTDWNTIATYNGSYWTADIVIQIGDWNMSSTTTLTVAHGLNSTYWKHVKDIVVIVRNDADTKYSNFCYKLNAGTTGTPTGSIDGIDSTNVTLTKEGSFNPSPYSTTSYNRGFITLKIK